MILANNRVAETVGGVKTLYLIDIQNPTGYAQPLEAKTQNTPGSTNTLTMTYILGDRVLGQADGTGAVSYLLTDGHGSTRLLVNSAGTVTAAFNYDAFGTALNFNAAMAATVFLSGGDAFFDAPSGLEFHGDGIRERMGFFFIERDFGPKGEGNPHDPISLHKYLYANADPINGMDPSGHEFNYVSQLLVTGIQSLLAAVVLSRFRYTAIGDIDPFKNEPPFLIKLLPITGNLASLLHDLRVGNKKEAVVDGAFMALELLPGGELLKGLGEASVPVITSLANKTQWVFRGTQAERALAEEYTRRLLANFIADGGKFEVRAGLAQTGKNGYYDFFSKGGPTIVLDSVTATNGTVLEELFHHMQVMAKMSEVKDYDRVGTWISSQRQLIEATAKATLQKFGFQREVIKAFF